MENRTILFYDGECGFCNRSVQFVLEHEKENLIYFAAIQSDFCKEFFKTKKYPEPDLTSLYFYSKGEVYRKSTAAFELLRFIKQPYRLLRIFRFIPLFVRDKIYDFIARRRHNIMPNYCTSPDPEQKSRFLI